MISEEPFPHVRREKPYSAEELKIINEALSDVLRMLRDNEEDDSNPVLFSKVNGRLGLARLLIKDIRGNE